VSQASRPFGSNIHTLELRVSEIGSEQPVALRDLPDQQAVCDMVQLFPNLQRLELSGPIYSTFDILIPEFGDGISNFETYTTLLSHVIENHPFENLRLFRTHDGTMDGKNLYRVLHA
jgi:hypothetical protein